MTEAKHVIRGTCDVGVMLGGAQVGLVRVMVQPVENMGRLIVAAITLVWKGPYRLDTWV